MSLTEEELTPKPEKVTIEYVPYQLCPKCNGQGAVSKPYYIAGDVFQWTASESIWPCDVCNGNKIIPMHKL